jgi:hypothetical protein
VALEAQASWIGHDMFDATANNDINVPLQRPMSGCAYLNLGGIDAIV